MESIQRSKRQASQHDQASESTLYLWDARINNLHMFGICAWLEADATDLDKVSPTDNNIGIILP